MPSFPQNTARLSTLTAIAALAIGGGAFLKKLPTPISPAFAAEGRSIPAPAVAVEEAAGEQIALFAGGCFWGMEGLFENVAGVSAVESGYAGGRMSDADYEKVGSNTTGHAETVRIHYDPAKISYNQLLHIFFSVAHDPTQRDRQGPDVGKQYRSAIFPLNDAQRGAAKAYIAQLDDANIWSKPIATKVEAGLFYAAEDYHQDFMRLNPDHPYILRWDVQKIDALKQFFPQLAR